MSAIEVRADGYTQDGFQKMWISLAAIQFISPKPRDNRLIVCFLGGSSLDIHEEDQARFLDAFKDFHGRNTMRIG